MVGFGLVVSRLNWLSRNSSSVGEKIKVTASIYPIYFLVNEIGGDLVEVVNMTPPGIAAHEYELTTGDMKKIANSKLVLVNGGVEPWAEKIPGAILLGKKYMIGNDPHVWLDPLLMIRLVADAKDILINIDPGNENIYRARGADLTAQLDKLDTEMRNGLARCEQRTIVTSHAAFGYLAGRYNLKQEEISGFSPENEPSAKRLAEVAKLVKTNNIKQIFFETLVNPDLALTIARETGAQTAVLNPLESLSAEEQVAGESYFSIQRKNLANLRSALECK